MDEEAKNNYIAMFTEWEKRTDEALAPFNDKINTLIKEAFETHPELTEVCLIIGITTYVVKRESFMKD